MSSSDPTEATPSTRQRRSDGWRLAMTSLIPPRLDQWPRSTRFWVLLLVAVSLVLVASVTLVAQQGLSLIRHDQAQVGQVRIPVVKEAYRLKIANERLFVGLRGFVITGDEQVLAPWSEGDRDFEAALATLRSLNASPRTRQSLTELERAHVAFEALGNHIIAMRRVGAPIETLQRLIAQGNQRKVRLDAQLDAIIAQQNADLAQAGAHLDRQEGRFELQLYGIAVLAVLVTLVLAMLVIWRVMFPLRALEEASLAVGSGQFGARVPRLDNLEFETVAEAFNQMAAHVERSIQALQDANTQLRENDRYKDEFLAVISHELRTPLNLILGFGGMLEAELQGPLTPQQRDCLERMMKGGKQMLALINDLLDMSQLAAGKLHLKQTEVVYPALIDQAVGIIRPLAEDKQLDVSVTLAPSQPVRLDSVRIVKVLTSLLSNAVKFTDRGGHIGVQAFIQENELVTEISDTGCGIAEADLPRLFEQFFQLDMSTTRRAGGAGLGLAIAKGMVQAHGGRIGVRSDVGKGSVFWFSLPLSRPAA
ncbi:MAG TPA: ATP-binding protein [Stenomitos sp.]